jgi:diadenosine tetraphosphate (Ap4A) HIT family hydrolase
MVNGGDPSSCFACEVNAGRIATPGGVIYEDEHWRAEHGVDRLIRGYVVLKPRRHVHELGDLEPLESATLGAALQRVVSAMRVVLAPDRIYVCSFAETVHHLHFHLLPRYRSLPPLGPGLVPDLFAGRWACSEEEARDAAESIRAAIGP